MSVGLSAPGKLHPVKGVKLAACHSGIKNDAAIDDLVLIELSDNSAVSAVFTTNKFCAAPVTIAKQYLDSTAATRFLLINSGNANAGTGRVGTENCISTCQAVAAETSVIEQSVLPFSTGVIGAQLPSDKIALAIPSLLAKLDEDNWLEAAKGIMTTDTLPKAVSRQLVINGETVTISGICKGSGMIKPDMATMLAYVATDALITQSELDFCFKQLVNSSFNSITVDGDTSTNDACLLIATGESQQSVDRSHTGFMSVLSEVFGLLAQSIIRDGEGATKFIEIQVEQALSSRDARELAYTIAHSPLVKTAFFASDANWGRILAAIGRAPVAELDIDKVDFFLGDVCLIENGLPHAEYTEQKGHAVMQQQDIVIHVNLNLGKHSATIWTTDLSYDYVKINAEYRS
ncbi:MAG: bifunctional glutamate N-acetyltransferase/amino-acid acetyltransferase ArgJ [Gammaproteobacteria bacterium]|nr:bifunctional glutamate N-acetyltransferase/amino-acid acetyltransferase ArgJ [Gammaproteobacteria bacterium]